MANPLSEHSSRLNVAAQLKQSTSQQSRKRTNYLVSPAKKTQKVPFQEDQLKNLSLDDTSNEADDEHTENAEVVLDSSIALRKVYFPKTKEHEQTSLEDYESLMKAYKRALITVTKLKHENETRLIGIEKAYNDACQAQSKVFQNDIRIIQTELLSKSSELSALRGDYSTLLQWCKCLFSELERATHSGALSAELKFTSSTIAKLLNEPLDSSKLEIIYRSFVESLSKKK